MTSGSDRLSFDDLLGVLDGWVGWTVTVAVLGVDGGRVHARLAGVLLRSREGAAWTKLDEAGGEAVVFQVGDDPHVYFVIYRSTLKGAEWIAEEHHFLSADLGPMCIAVEATAPS